MPTNKILLIYIFLTVATLLAFWQVNHYDFISYDDNDYLTENSHIQNGLTIDGIRWAFTTGYATNWHPLTWVSHMADVQFFGLNPQWHHLTNLLLHIANTLLLFFVLHRMTKALWQSAFVAALFALHPLHVESVAWVAERKDVLSTFFWMLTMGAYCYYVERRGPWRYLSVLIFFALGLMAKPMLVTLPFVLLLMDYWPLGRLKQRVSAKKIQTKSAKPIIADKRKGKPAKGNAVIKEETEAKRPVDSKYRWTLIMQLVWEKTPLFILAILSSIVTYIVQHEGGAVGSLESIPLSVRIGNAFLSYITYIVNMIWPHNLAVFYPYHMWASWQVFGAALVFITITLIIVWTAKRFEYLTAGWLWYVGTLVPVIGLVKVGLQARADRYTYIPLIGLFIMGAWGITELLGQWRHRKKVLVASSSLALSFFFIITWTQVGYWQNSFKLFNHALEVTHDNSVAYDCRGSAYVTSHNYKEALMDYDRAIRINPNLASTYNNRGVAYGALGRQTEAIADYSMAIQINPKLASTYNNQGNAYIALGNYKQAIMDFDKAIRINPEYAGAYNNRGLAYGALGRQTEAIADYSMAIQINPKAALAYNCRGNAYAALHDYGQAIKDYDRAIQINPKLALAYHDRGSTYAALHNYEQAIKDYDRAIQINPKLALAYNDRGSAYAALHNYEQAIKDYDRAIQINPNLASAYHNRAASYDRLGNRKQAYEDLKSAALLGEKAAQDFLKNQGANW